MQLAIHLSLLLGVIAIAAVSVAWRPGFFPRSTPRIVVAVVPFLLIGAICLFLSSGTGIPSREWFVPAVAVLAVGIGCRSEGAFKAARWGFLAASLILCNNFTSLVHGEFTANPKFSSRVAQTKQSAEIASASTALIKSHAAGDHLSEGPLSAILNQPHFDSIEGVTVERQWHTPLTGLFRVRRTRGSLWYSGGDIATSSRLISWHPNL